MSQIVRKFDYKPCEQKNQEDGRKYKTPDGDLVPSVTTILDKTKDKTGIIAWREKVGEYEANKIMKESTNLGSMLHNHIENHVKGIERQKGNNFIHQMANDMADTIIGRGLPKIDEVWGVEEQLYYPGLYAGTADMIGVYKGKPAIIDHKNTRNPKKEEWLEDYFCQLTAYASAHNVLFDTNIRCGVIFMVSRDNQYQEWVISGDKFDYYMQVWTKRLAYFYGV